MFQLIALLFVFAMLIVGTAMLISLARLFTCAPRAARHATVFSVAAAVILLGLTLSLTTMRGAPMQPEFKSVLVVPSTSKGEKASDWDVPALVPITVSTSEEPGIEPQPAKTSTTQIDISAPAWIGQKAEQRGKRYVAPIVSGRFATQEDAKLALDKVLQTEIAKYAQRKLGHDDFTAEMVPVSYINHSLVHDRYMEPVASAVLETTMYRAHALLEVDAEQDRQLERFWRDHTVEGRLWMFGAGAGGLLALLSTLWGTLKLTEKTKTKTPEPEAVA